MPVGATRIPWIFLCFQGDAPGKEEITPSQASHRQRSTPG